MNSTGRTLQHLLRNSRSRRSFTRSLVSASGSSWNTTPETGQELKITRLQGLHEGKVSKSVDLILTTIVDLILFQHLYHVMYICDYLLGVTVLSVNRPEVRNAISFPLLEQVCIPGLWYYILKLIFL